MRDNFELMFFVLQELTRETSKYYQYRYERSQMPKYMEIDAEDFESRIKELSIHDPVPFYSSRFFVGNGYRYEASKKAILKDF
jgi:DNA replication licensing factor MCM2